MVTFSGSPPILRTQARPYSQRTLLRVLTAIVLPSRSCPDLIPDAFGATSAARSGSFARILLAGATVMMSRPREAARTVETTLPEVMSSAPLMTPGMPTAPPVVGVVSTVNPSWVKKPWLTAM
jgi:hypothetical protein